MMDEVEQDYTTIDSTDIEYDRFSTTRLKLVDLVDGGYAVIGASAMSKNPLYHFVEQAETEEELRDLEEWREEI